jgi:hypothetical protein
MRLTRLGNAIGAMLIGLALLLATPTIGSSQETDLSGSVDRPLSYALSSISWFSWNGIWVRSNGMWAWRPTVRYDWQAYFRCTQDWQSFFRSQSSEFVGASYAPGSWLPGRYSRWDFVPGLGWVWSPGQRFNNAWNLWYLGPRSAGGTSRRSCSDPYDPQSFIATGWDGGLTLVSVDQRPGQDRDGWKPPTDANTRDHTRPLVHPVRDAPFVTVSADGEDSEPSGRKAPQRPSIDPVLPTRAVETLFEPTSIQRARQKSLRRREIDLLEPTRKGNRLRSAPDLSRLAPEGLRWESPRALELTNPWVYRNRVTTGIDRMPSARSWPGATRLQSEGYRPAQPQSNGRSKSTGKNRAAPKQ